MMIAPHHLAAKSGSDILKEGGNALEAMIASAAMISVVYPHMKIKMFTLSILVVPQVIMQI